jgi:alkyl hydroperoxide reductase subunit AhpC
VGVREAAARRPAFAVTTRTGQLVTADSLRGRVVFVNIWATWCPPCRAEMPALQQLADAYAAEGLVMLGLSVDRGPAQTVDEFLAERSITYPVAIVGDDVISCVRRSAGVSHQLTCSIALAWCGIRLWAPLGPLRCGQPSSVCWPKRASSPRVLPVA